MLKKFQCFPVCIIAAFICCQTCWAQLDALILEQTIEPRIPVHAPPGGEAEFEIVLRNDGEIAIPTVELAGSGAYWADWMFQTLTPGRCGDIRHESGSIPGPGTSIFAWATRLEVNDVLPGESLICRYLAKRTPESMRDSLLTWNILPAEGEFVPLTHKAVYAFGSLAEVSLSVTPLCSDSPDNGQRLVEVSIHNAGPTQVENIGFGDCHAVPSFRIDGRIERGCGENWGPPWFCPGVGYPIGWRVGDVAAGETKRCMLMLDDSMPSNVGSDTISIRMEDRYTSGLSIIAEIDPTTNWASLSVASPPPACMTQEALPVPLLTSQKWPAVALLCMLLLIATHFAMRRF